MILLFSVFEGGAFHNATVKDLSEVGRYKTKYSFNVFDLETLSFKSNVMEHQYFPTSFSFQIQRNWHLLDHVWNHQLALSGCWNYKKYSTKS